MKAPSTNSGASTITKPHSTAKNDKGHNNVGKEHGATNKEVVKFNKSAEAANKQGGSQH